MAMDMDFPIDMPEVMNIVDTSDVVIVRFTTVAKRLLLDFRGGAGDPPLIRLVRRVRSPEERFRELRRLRPGVQVPDQIMSFHWPKDVSSFQRLGVLDRIMERAQRTGHPSDEQCRTAYAELLELERSELMAAVRGGGYQTLWERQPT